jgi:hypothetical protein
MKRKVSCLFMREQISLDFKVKYVSVEADI